MISFFSSVLIFGLILGYGFPENARTKSVSQTMVLVSLVMILGSLTIVGTVTNTSELIDEFALIVYTGGILAMCSIGVWPLIQELCLGKVVS